MSSDYLALRRESVQNPYYLSTIKISFEYAVEFTSPPSLDTLALTGEAQEVDVFPMALRLLNSDKALREGSHFSRLASFWLNPAGVSIGSGVEL